MSDNPKPPKLIAHKKPRKLPPKRLTKEELERILLELVSHKQRKELLEKGINTLQKILLEQCQLQGKDKVEFEESGMVFTGTVVSPELTQVDDAGLLEAVLPHIRELIEKVVRTVDRKSVEVLIERGDLDQEIVKEHITTKKAKSYIKISEKKSQLDE